MNGQQVRLDISVCNGNGIPDFDNIIQDTPQASTFLRFALLEALLEVDRSALLRKAEPSSPGACDLH